MAAGSETATDTEGDPTALVGADGLAPGTLIDRYEVEQRLGAGGMGVVYAARDIHLGRVVAIKIASPRIDPSSGHSRLVREAQAMAKLRHPNLATVYDIGVSAERLFVVIELVDGGTVTDWLKAATRSWRAIVGVFLQAARGLAAAHAAGFVHRDFKPDNVLYGRDGVARVSDFGVAGILGDAAISGGVVGSPGYIAPEILRREPVDARADQFSFCVSLYAALYGERPFAARSGADRVAETQGARRPSPVRIGPAWLRRIVTRGLAPDPGARWPTMDALIAAIEHRLGHRRARIAATAGGVALVALGAIAALTTSRSTPVAVPDWTPVAIGRERAGGPRSMIVSGDGSILASISSGEAWVEPRAGGAVGRRVVFPYSTGAELCLLSRTGDRLVCSFDRGAKSSEIWELDVATAESQLRASGTLFDVGADRSILFGSAGLAELWRSGRDGGVTRLVAARPGELITGATLSPDGARLAYRVRSSTGARIELLTLASGSGSVVSHRICKDLAWLGEHSLVCVPRTFRNPIVIELVLSDAGDATERVRYTGPEYNEVRALSVSSTGLLLATASNDKHLQLVALDAASPPRAIASGAVTDLPAVGWTASGALIFGAVEHGHLRIMAHHSDGRVEVLRPGPSGEVPLAVLGESIVFGRFPGGETTIPFFETPFGRRYPDGELFALTSGDLPDRAIEPRGGAHGFSALLCAPGGVPCLLVEHTSSDMIAIDWDPATGTRGRERTRWQMTHYSATGALSPDGRTLAQVRRVLARSELSLLDLDSGQRRRVDASGASLDFPSWRRDGSLFAIRSSRQVRTIVSIGDARITEEVAVLPWATVEELRIHRDGKLAAVLTADALQTYWWIATRD